MWSRHRKLILALVALLVLAFLFVLVAISYSFQEPLRDLASARAWVASRHPQVPRLTGQELAALPGARFLLIDVRSEAEWSVSHLLAAFHCEDPASAVAEAGRRHLNHVVVYCSIGERSSRLAERMLALNPSLLIHDLAGGIFTWASDDRPLVDANGQPTQLVHPYDHAWGALLPADHRAQVP